MKEELLPVDLGHLEDKAQKIVQYFHGFHDVDRSLEYRAIMLKNAERVAEVLVRDFAYYFDKKKIGGMIPMGLENVEVIYPPTTP